MPLLFGAHFQQDNASDNKPHIFSFGTARTTASDTLFELWNGTSSASIRVAVDLDGKFYSNALTAGDMLYAVTGGVANVRRLDSLSIGSANKVLTTNGTIPVWSATITDPTLAGTARVTGSLRAQDTGIIYIVSTLTGPSVYHVEFAGTTTSTGLTDNLTTFKIGTAFYSGHNGTGSSATALDLSPTFRFTAGGAYNVITELRIGGSIVGSPDVTTWYGIKLVDIGGTGTHANSYGIHINDINSATNNWALYTEGGTVTILGDGIVVGAATAGDKGAGTINVATDIYKNNTVYTDPDAVLERQFTGKVVVHKDSPFASYPGLLSLADVEQFARDTFQLPRVAWAKGVFERTDALLEKVEETFLYLFDHERRIRELEKAA